MTNVTLLASGAAPLPKEHSEFFGALEMDIVEVLLWFVFLCLILVLVSFVAISSSDIVSLSFNLIEKHLLVSFFFQSSPFPPVSEKESNIEYIFVTKFTISFDIVSPFDYEMSGLRSDGMYWSLLFQSSVRSSQWHGGCTSSWRSDSIRLQARDSCPRTFVIFFLSLQFMIACVLVLSSWDSNWCFRLDFFSSSLHLLFLHI